MHVYSYRTHVSLDTIEFVGDCWADGGVNTDETGKPVTDSRHNSIAWHETREISVDDTDVLIAAYAGDEGLTGLEDLPKFAAWLAESGLAQDVVQQIVFANGVDIP